MATRTRMSHDVFSARRFLGKDVFDANRNQVGEVEDLIIDVKSACARWAIVSTGGTLGIGQTHRIVPIQMVAIESDTGRIMLQFGGDRLNNSPRYDRDNPPDWSDRAWQESIASYYGMQRQGIGGQGMEGSMQGQGMMGQGMQGRYGYESQQGMQGQEGYSGPERRHGMGGYSGPDRRHEEGQAQEGRGRMGMEPIGQQQPGMRH